MDKQQHPQSIDASTAYGVNSARSNAVKHRDRAKEGGRRAPRTAFRNARSEDRDDEARFVLGYN